MFSRIWIVNFCLALLVIFLAKNVYEVWSNGEKGVPKTPAVKRPLSISKKIVAKKAIPPGSDYEVVVQKNLFWPDRLASEPKKAVGAPAAQHKADARLLKLLERDLKSTNLYGVIMVGNHKEALIGEVPASGRKGVRAKEKGIKRAKVGDTVGRFKVKEIKKTSVVLSAGGGHEWQVSLFDIDKPKRRIRAKKTGPVVIGMESKRKALVAKGSAEEKERPPRRAASRRKKFPMAKKKQRNPSAPDRSRPEG